MCRRQVARRRVHGRTTRYRSSTVSQAARTGLRGVAQVSTTENGSLPRGEATPCSAGCVGLRARRERLVRCDSPFDDGARVPAAAPWPGSGGNVEQDQDARYGIPAIAGRVGTSIGSLGKQVEGDTGAFARAGAVASGGGGRRTPHCGRFEDHSSWPDTRGNGQRQTAPSARIQRQSVGNRARVVKVAVCQDALRTKGTSSSRDSLRPPGTNGTAEAAAPLRRDALRVRL